MLCRPAGCFIYFILFDLFRQTLGRIIMSVGYYTSVLYAVRCSISSTRPIFLLLLLSLLFLYRVWVARFISSHVPAIILAPTPNFRAFSFGGLHLRLSQKTKKSARNRGRRKSRENKSCVEQANFPSCIRPTSLMPVSIKTETMRQIMGNPRKLRPVKRTVFSIFFPMPNEVLLYVADAERDKSHTKLEFNWPDDDEVCQTKKKKKEKRGERTVVRKNELIFSSYRQRRGRTFFPFSSCFYHHQRRQLRETDRCSDDDAI